MSFLHISEFISKITSDKSHITLYKSMKSYLRKKFFSFTELVAGKMNATTGSPMLMVAASLTTTETAVSFLQATSLMLTNNKSPNKFGGDVSPVTLSSEWSRMARLLLISCLSVVGSIGNVFMISSVMIEDHLKKAGKHRVQTVEFIFIQYIIYLLTDHFFRILYLKAPN